MAGVDGCGAADGVRGDRGWSMIRKSGNRFSEKITLKQKARAGCRPNHNSCRSRLRLRFEVAPTMAALALLALPGCSSLGDLGYVDHPAVADNIHAWVGQEAAARAGAPISLANLTEDERTLRDVAFPLIQPAYARGRWDRSFMNTGRSATFSAASGSSIRPALLPSIFWPPNFRSTAGRYNRLNDDIRNDVVMIGHFFLHRPSRDRSRPQAPGDDGDDPRHFTGRAVQRLGAGLREQSRDRLGAGVAGAACRQLSLCAQSYGDQRA